MSWWTGVTRRDALRCCSAAESSKACATRSTRGGSQADETVSNRDIRELPRMQTEHCCVHVMRRKSIVHARSDPAVPASGSRGCRKSHDVVSWRPGASLAALPAIVLRGTHEYVPVAPRRVLRRKAPQGKGGPRSRSATDGRSSAAGWHRARNPQMRAPEVRYTAPPSRSRHRAARGQPRGAGTSPRARSPVPPRGVRPTRC